jgi:hypothetical protein
LILLFTALEYLLFYKGFYAISADESGRTLEAYKFYKYGSDFYSCWLPFQKIIYSTAFYFYYNLFILSRLISFVFGILTLVSIIALSHELFHNKIISVLTGFLAIIFPAFTIFSILPLSEIYYFFFVITSVMFYVKWWNNSNYLSLWLSVIFMCIGMTTRYETWIFAAVLYLMIANRLHLSGGLNGKKIILLAAIFIILFSFPLYWIHLSYLNTRRVFGLVDAVASNYLSNNNIPGIKDYVFYTFLEFNATSLNILGIISVILLFKIFACIKQYVFLLFSTLIIFSVISYQMNAMPNHNFWRLSMIWSAMLLPFTAHFLYRLYTAGQSSLIKSMIFIILLAAVSYLFVGQTMRISSASYISSDDFKIGKILQQRFKEEKFNLYIEPCGWDYLGIQVISENPDMVITKLSNFDKNKDSIFYVNGALFSELKQKNISYFVLRPFTKISSAKVKMEPLRKFILWQAYKIQF